MTARDSARLANFDTTAFAIPGCPATNPVCANPAKHRYIRYLRMDDLTGPPIRNLDFGPAKDFRLRERYLFRFTMTMADALNHPSFTIPAANISSVGTVGAISGTTHAALAEPPSRQINFSLRLNF